MTVRKKKTKPKSIPALPESVSSTIQQLVDTRIKESGSASSVDGESFISAITKQAIESLIQAELDEHLRECKESEQENSKNGFGKKKVKGDFGEIELEVPRDRKSSFEPKIVPKRQREIGNFSEKVISLYAKGMTTREIEKHLEEMYGIEVSPQFVSHA